MPGASKFVLLPPLKRYDLKTPIPCRRSGTIQSTLQVTKSRYAHIRVPSSCAILVCPVPFLLIGPGKHWGLVLLYSASTMGEGAPARGAVALRTIPRKCAQFLLCPMVLRPWTLERGARCSVQQINLFLNVLNV